MALAMTPDGSTIVAGSRSSDALILSSGGSVTGSISIPATHANGVAISDDGSVVAVRYGPGETSYSGVVVVKDGVSQTISDSDIGGIGVSADGTRVLTGHAGDVWIYEYIEGAWEHTCDYTLEPMQSILGLSGPPSPFALAIGGNRVVTGDPLTDAGAAFVHSCT
jgi:hypothetical protein